MAPPTPRKADRIFVQNGRRLYRRRFSATEARIGLLVVFVLAAIVGWVAWKGAHPDPALFALEADLSQNAAVPTVDRGPLPDELAGEGWSEGKLSEFDYDNLYVKIDGREGYYKSFGFERLYFLSIINDENAQRAVDIELYDLGSAANAIGAYSGERSPDVTSQPTTSGFAHMERNALFLAQGRFYLRAIGSDESPEVLAQLAYLRKRFEAQLPAEALPWGYALLVGRMGMAPERVSFTRENAFSFGFARNVYSTTLEDDAELFVTFAGSEADARPLAIQYREGFMQYGRAGGDFVWDRYRGTAAFVRAVGPWVVGFHRATAPQEAYEATERLAEAVSDFPAPAESTEPSEPGNVEEEYETDAY